MGTAKRSSRDSSLQIILAGAFGGLLAPVLRVALAFTQQTAEIVDFNFLYWVGAFILAILGAGVVWGFGETKRQKAILLGLSLPAFLQVAVTDFQRNNLQGETLTNHSSAALSFISSAYAASDNSPAPAPTNAISSQNMRRTLSARSLNADQDIAIVFLDPNGKTALSVSLPAKADLQIPIPDSAIALKFAIGDSTSKAFPLTNAPNSTITFQVKANTRIQYDLLSAFGKRPKSTTTFEVTQPKESGSKQITSANDPCEPDGNYSYRGYVGPYGAEFRLIFAPGEQVAGNYSMTVDNGLMLRLEGRRQGGQLVMDEYTENRLTAKITLVRRKTTTEVRFEGVMRNTPPDNRVFPVSFFRPLN